MVFHFLDLSRKKRRDRDLRSNRSRSISADRYQSESLPGYATPLAPLDSSFDMDSDLRGNLRRRVQIRAEIRESGGARYDIWVSDISQSGFRMQLLCQLNPDKAVLLLLPGMKPLRARIAWRDGNFYGCMFERPLHIAVFENIARIFGD